tara:strand:- start:163 stop:1143 length:981 start_codon:yes stop_codon:yes gene_type:complete
MTKVKFSVDENPTPENWNNLINNSPQSNIFCESIYLNLLDNSFRQIIIKKGSDIKAGLVFIESKSKEDIVEDELLIYGGILFMRDSIKKNVKKVFDNYEITEFIVNYVSNKYKKIFLNLSPEIKDLRPFLWYEYHSKESDKKYSVDLRYTSYLNISEIKHNDFLNTQFYESMHTLRKRHIKKANKDKYKVNFSNVADNIIDFYQALMTKQGIKTDENKLFIMRNLINELIDNKRGVLIEIVNQSKIVLYSVFYVWDSKRAYFLFGAGNPEISEQWQGTIAHLEAFKYLSRSKSITEVDFEGVNSPQRGWFKLSFGGELISYYHLNR